MRRLEVSSLYEAVTWNIFLGLFAVFAWNIPLVSTNEVIGRNDQCILQLFLFVYQLVLTVSKPASNKVFFWCESYHHFHQWYSSFSRNNFLSCPHHQGWFNIFINFNSLFYTVYFNFTTSTSWCTILFCPLGPSEFIVCKKLV